MQRFRSWFDAWLARRSPLSNKVRLTNRNIYIFPSKPGWLLVAVLLVMLLTAINYQNSLVFGMCFWLGSVFAVLIWHTWKNLAGLEVSVGSEVAGFVGETVPVSHKITALDRSVHFNIKMHWRRDVAMSSGVDIEKGHGDSVQLLHHVLSRGWNQTPRIEVLSRYPLGILTAWSVIQLEHPVLGYPKPVFGVTPNIHAEGAFDQEGDAQNSHRSKQSGSDFDSLTPYIEGDSLKKVDWKRFAKTEELVTKSFVTPPVSNTWLKFEDFQGLPLEQRLSAMAGWVIEWSNQNKVFGLSLPNQQLPQGTGEQHQLDCLRALALFDADQTDSSEVKISSKVNRMPEGNRK
ncbi:DUF58 domain-containing protein [Litoribrevibacter albus]|uniref:DUF58 domain-containing protein n=1 Tax=Litoribrevibacter albus TaxID=1473156 RepID=A0AA37W808_9GAMM|nr:DUF58 domain-containing protein [Litoribrevibacter albus]GLQ30926.1 hypothetical protein GCM10007876_14050 [Litoribrevibacter albus]